jgi:hypothetical protein
MFQSIPEGAVIFASDVMFCCANTLVLEGIRASTMIGVRNMVLMSYTSSILIIEADINPSQIHNWGFSRHIKLKVVNELANKSYHDWWSTLHIKLSFASDIGGILGHTPVEIKKYIPNV